MPGSIELRACPFCGGEARIIAKPYEPKVCVGCDDDTCLGFSGLGWLYDSEKEATEAWNRRLERTCRMVRARWDDGECVWGCRCTACGDRFTYETGTTWRYCPACGARVVEEEK